MKSIETKPFAAFFSVTLALQCGHFPGVAVAGNEGSGLRGGGDAVLIENHPRLRDLVDQTSCRWMPGDLFLKRLKSFRKIMSSLRETHWYLQQSIEREALTLRVCLTGPLLKIDTEDQAPLTIYRRFGVRQTAIRLPETIYIDETILNDMSNDDQAMLAIHEIVHSFIPLDVEWRNQKVKSLVRGIWENHRRRMSHRELAAYLVSNDVTIAPDVSAWNAVEASVATLTDVSASQADRLKAFARVGIEPVHELLTPRDQSLARTGIDPAYYGALQSVESNDLSVLRSWIDAGVDPDVRYFYGESRSLIEIASDAANDEIITYLLNLEQSQAADFALTPAERVLLRVIEGSLETVSLDLIFGKGIDPNAVVTVKILGRKQVTTLLGAAAAYRKNEIADRLLATGLSTQSTRDEAFVRLLGSSSEESALDWLDRGFVEMETILPNSKTPFETTIDHGLAELVKGLIKRGVDVNRATQAGWTPLDRALALQHVAIADLIASAPGFVFEFVPSQDAAETHARALTLLYRFIDLNLLPVVEQIVALEHFTWFELTRASDIARLRKRPEIADFLKTQINKPKH